MLKKSLVSALMLGVVFFAIASSGGGKKKSSSKMGVVPVSARLLTTGSKPAYSGSNFLSTINTRNATVYRSMITYQRGNTTYIVPSQFKVNNSKVCFKSSKLSFRSNLNVIDLKVRLCK